MSKIAALVPATEAATAADTVAQVSMMTKLSMRGIIEVDEESAGFTKTVNAAGERLEDEDYVLLLNEDVRVRTEDWAERMVEEIERYAPHRVWFAGPSGRCRTKPQNEGRVGDKRRPRLVSHLAGFFLLMKRVAWDKAGGLSEDYVHYASDVDVQWRMRQEHGARALWVPGVWVEHEVHQPLVGWWKRDQAVLNQRWAAQGR